MQLCDSVILMRIKSSRAAEVGAKSFCSRHSGQLLLQTFKMNQQQDKKSTALKNVGQWFSILFLPCVF